MNKLTKAAIAGAAGIALLLGGAGSLAYWNDATALDAASINSGTLTISDDDVATTTYLGGGAVGLIVPGDTVVISQGVVIAATGDNLEATLDIDATTLVGALEPFVTYTVKAFDGATEVTNLTTLSASDAASIDRVEVTVVFPTSVEDTDGQGLALDLGELIVTLTQNV